MNHTRFSRIVAGVMGWGSWGKRLDTGEMAARIRGCCEIGVTTFDHADIYGDHSTEAAFGAALQASGIARASIQLISKCGIKLPGAQVRTKHYDYGHASICDAVDRSLQNLGTDYLDLLLLHRPSPLLDPEIVAAAVGELLRAGRIRAFGVSNFTPSGIALLRPLLDVDVNQIECSLLQCEPMFDGTLDAHLQQRMVTMAWAPLGGLFGSTDARAVRTRHAVDELARKYACAPEQLVLAWLCQHPARIIPVVGTTELDRMRLAHAAATMRLDTEDWFALLEASRGHPVA